MRKFKMGLITLAASAAVLAPLAGPASASTQSASTTNTAASLGCVVLCFDLYVDDVLSDNDVDVLTAANFCGIQVIELNVLSIGQIVDCGDGHKKVKRSK